MSDVAAILGKPLCALAFCWRLERRDGIALGLTSHDRPLRIGGFDYAASPGMVPNAVRWTGTIDASVMDVEGVLADHSISADDLAIGRWDGAAVRLHLTEWTDPGALWLELACGTLGEVRQQGAAFVAALNSRKGAFGNGFAPATSPSCRAALGDAACRVDMAARRRIAKVGAIAGERLTVAGLDGALFGAGRLRWLGGPLCGLWTGIADGAPGMIVLEEPPPVAVLPGTWMLMEEGCDKRLVTCSNRFANAANFRGEPFLPGNDLLTRYPGA